MKCDFSINMVAVHVLFVFVLRCGNLSVEKALELLNGKLEEPITEVQLVSIFYKWKKDSTKWGFTVIQLEMRQN